LGHSRQGFPAVAWVPVNTSVHLLQLVAVRLHVIGGTARNLSVAAPRSLTHAPLVKTWQNSLIGRIGRLDVHADMGSVANSSLTDLNLTDTAHQANIRFLPGTTLPDGTTIDTYTHPAVVRGAYAGGNTGTAQTIDPGGAAYWMATYTLTGNVTFTLQNVPKGATIDLLLTQDASGSRTVAFTPPAGGSVKYAGGSLGMTAAAGSVDLITLTTLDGLNFLVSGVHDIK
jgi:hypothetical protein